jgi:hypothetical protein
MSAPRLTQYVQGQGVVSGDQLNTFEQTCDNLVQLRALIGVKGMQVFTRGIAVPGDGGAGPFYWNTTALGPDDNLNVVVPQPGVPGAWVRLAIAQESVVSVPNIAALRALTGGGAVPVVWVEGYYTPADQGEGMFVYIPGDVTSPDNNGTIIIDAQNHRYYREIQAMPYSVKWFGAHGDGTTDDHTPIQQTINYVESIGGGEVYLPAAIYASSNTVVIATSSMKVSGAARHATVISFTNPTADGIQLGSASGGNAVTISDLSIRWTVAVTAGYGLHFFGGGLSYTVERVGIGSPYVGVYMSGAPAATFQYKLDDFYITSSLSDGIRIGSDSVGTNAVIQYYISRGDISNAGGNGIEIQWSGSGFYRDIIVRDSANIGVHIGPGGSLNTTVSSVDFSGVDCFANVSSNWRVDGNSGTVNDVTCIGCIANNSATDIGVYIAGIPANFTWANGIVTGNFLDGIFVGGGLSVVITGNLISNNSGQASGARSGITTYTNVSNFIIANNSSGALAPGNNQEFGINISSAGSNHYIVSNNLLFGNVAGGLNDAGTGPNKSVTGNVT